MYQSENEGKVQTRARFAAFSPESSAAAACLSAAAGSGRILRLTAGAAIEPAAVLDDVADDEDEPETDEDEKLFSLPSTAIGAIFSLRFGTSVAALASEAATHATHE